MRNAKAMRYVTFVRNTLPRAILVGAVLLFTTLFFASALPAGELIVPEPIKPDKDRVRILAKSVKGKPAEVLAKLRQGPKPGAYVDGFGQLIDPGADAGQQLLTAYQRGHRALHPHITSLTDSPQLASVADGLDMWVFAWTVDDPEAIRALRDAGITGAITNDPAAALAALA